MLVGVGIGVGAGWVGSGELIGEGRAVFVGSGTGEPAAWQAIRTIKAMRRKRRTAQLYPSHLTGKIN